MPRSVDLLMEDWPCIVLYYYHRGDRRDEKAIMTFDHRTTFRLFVAARRRPSTPQQQPRMHILAYTDEFIPDHRFDRTNVDRSFIANYGPTPRNSALRLRWEPVFRPADEPRFDIDFVGPPANTVLPRGFAERGVIPTPAVLARYRPRASCGYVL